ncbi:hypothetical protein [Streptomyces alboflavus]|uniref:hypothetical protein n=1 Tax=Streptomyces alboflavus TaxID=67267 RepID=UPI001F3B7963|nr:hypothetical protein [Streptomyces alboflavus]
MLRDLLLHLLGHLLLEVGRDLLLAGNLLAELALLADLTDLAGLTLLADLAGLRRRGARALLAGLLLAELLAVALALLAERLLLAELFGAVLLLRAELLALLLADLTHLRGGAHAGATFRQWSVR